MSNKRNIDLRKLDKNMSIQQTNDRDLMWYDPREDPFQVNGFAWFEAEKNYRRLPEAASGIVPEAVDHLATCTAGGQIRFQTDSTRLLIKVKLAGKANMNHMTAVGQCGFDCYIGEFGKQQYFSSSLYDHLKDFYEVTLFERATTEFQTITLNFPLYQGVEEVFIGLDQSALVKEPPKYDHDSRIIFYGTSITQGGCATRPGLAYTNILSRRINQEFINLGFSGNGKGEAIMAEMISSIENPACLVLDYEPNCVSTELYMQTLPEFVSIYRKKHPEVPILLISKFPYASEQLNPDLLNDRLKRLAFQQDFVRHLQENGDQQIYFYEGTDLLGENLNECTVDGIHPNDLGFMSIADQLTPVLKKILKSKHT